MAGEDPEYVRAVHHLRCAAASLGPCQGSLEAHHVRVGTGLSKRPHDWLCAPLCARHHDHLHDGGGVFDGWSKERKREWFRAAVEETLRAVREGVGPEWW